ncbi:MAG: DUF922 domain-containing protein [Pseudomonadales bacterium]|nr:DUF922 domain-containing protein [Halioglobus sp.]MCP5131818.1 DUF922 domain-containing protein [Pseudomonadales bacterium]
MLAWVRAAAILGTSILLMGSKIIIHVPQGGSVVSSSGLFACSAGETCTIELDERHHAETFTAVADSGYEFHGWGDKAGSLCQGSRNPYCEELDNGAVFDAEPGFKDRRRSGGAITMNPSFVGSDYPQTQVTPRFSINSFHTTHYYQVQGNTQEEVWAQLHGSANPLAVDRRAGAKPLGHADFRYQYDYRSAYGTGMSSCKVDSGTLVFRFETVLPRLALQEDTSDHLKDHWQPFQELITEHEAGHHAIYRQLVTQLPQVLIDVGEVPCDELSDRVAEAVEYAVSEVRQASVAYDEYYGGEDYLASSL